MRYYKTAQKNFIYSLADQCCKFKIWKFYIKANKKIKLIFKLFDALNKYLIYLNKKLLMSRTGAIRINFK